MITYPLSLPLNPSAYTLQQISVNQVFDSPFTLQQQVVRGYGEAWGLSVTFPTIARTDPAYNVKVDKIHTFLGSLKGRYGTFKFYLPNNDAQYTVTSGNPAIYLSTINNDIGDNVTFSNPSGAAFSFGANGTYITMGTQLFRILSATYDGTNITCDVFPRVRTNLAAGTSVEYRQPYGIFRSKTAQTQINRDENHIYTFSIDAVEAV